MAVRELLILCVCVMPAVSGSHMQGGLMTFRVGGRNPDGSLMVNFRYKSSFNSGCHSEFYWRCYSGNCGNVVQQDISTVDSGSYPYVWCQSETFMVRRVPNDKPFQLTEESCCWVYSTGNYPGWSLRTSVDLGTRSDTTKPNHSPVTTIVPVIRIPRNCPLSLNLMAHDPDGDIVKCRYGNRLAGECSNCMTYSHFYLNQNNCTLSYSSSFSTGSYIFELVLEDFPRKDISLRYSDGTVTHKYSQLLRRRREVTETYWPETTDTATDIHEITTDLTTDESSTESISLTAEIYLSTTYETTDAATDIHEITTDLTTNDESIILTEEIYPSTTYETTDAATDIHEITTDLTTNDESIILTTEIYPSTTYETTQYYTEGGYHYTDSSTFIHLTETESATSVTAKHTSALDTLSDTSSYTLNPQTEEETLSTAHPPASSALSKIPLQFLLEVSGTVSSCVYGLYRPNFLTPTPKNGEIFLARIQNPLQLHLLAEATHDSIVDFKISGPSHITKRLTSSVSSSKGALLEWIPTTDYIGEHVPICFVAETRNGYQSEMRCVIIKVVSNKLANATLTCSGNTMTLIIAKTPEGGLYENHLRLNDPSCLVTSNGTHLIASVGFNSCGTRTEETKDYIVFKNQISSFDKMGDVITRKHQVVIPFNCSFPKEKRVSAAFRAQRAYFEFTEAGFGNFTYKFQFYQDDQFLDVHTKYPLNFQLREMIYMEIQVTSVMPNVQLFVESCRATPHDNPNDPVFYDIIKNGCPRDETLVNYPGTNTKYRFGIEAFAFIGNYEEVYVSCIVILCKRGEPNTRCTQGCVTASFVEPNSHRRRRSLISETQQHFISQGPLRLQRSASSNRDLNENPSLNVNTLVVAIAIIAVVALIALITHNKAKVRRLNYERLPTHDF